MNWQSLVECSNAKPLDDTIKLPQAFKDHWKPNDIDRVVAWEFYDQLRSRIASQPMHYMHGDEATALESIFKLFGGTERGRRHRKGTQLFSIEYEQDRLWRCHDDHGFAPQIPVSMFLIAQLRGCHYLKNVKNTKPSSESYGKPEPQSENELESLRQSVIRGTPYNSVSWVTQSAVRLQLNVHYARRGVRKSRHQR